MFSVVTQSGVVMGIAVPWGWGAALWSQEVDTRGAACCGRQRLRLHLCAECLLGVPSLVSCCKAHLDVCEPMCFSHVSRSEAGHV